MRKTKRSLPYQYHRGVYVDGRKADYAVTKIHGKCYHLSWQHTSLMHKSSDFEKSKEKGRVIRMWNQSIPILSDGLWVFKVNFLKSYCNGFDIWFGWFKFLGCSHWEMKYVLPENHIKWPQAMMVSVEWQSVLCFWRNPHRGQPNASVLYFLTAMWWSTCFKINSLIRS